MGSWYEYECNYCHYKVTTGGLLEFYRDESGIKKRYGHPLPFSEEAQKCGMKGFSVEAYCLNCKKIFDVIKTEFKNSSIHEGKPEILIHYREFICPECNEKLYEFLDNVKCPKCEDGVFKVITYIQS